MFYSCRTILAVFFLLTFTACDSTSDSEGDPSLRGEGFIELDGVRNDFTIEICDLSGEVDDEYQTIYGMGNMPDGDRFYIYVSRNMVNDLLIHSVSFQTGNVAQGEGTVIQSSRMHMNGQWSDLFDGPDEPLIQISGNTVTATGTFYVNENLDETIPGRFEATCN